MASNGNGKGKGKVDDELDELKMSKGDLEKLVVALDRLHRRNRIRLYGYIVALLALIGGQLTALYVYGTTPRESFMGWVFLVPFAMVGGILWLFGKLAKGIK